MSAETQQVKYLLNAIVKAKPEEIDCDEAQSLVDQYIELDLAGEAIPSQLKELQYHLEWCGCCRHVVDAIKAAISGLDNENT